MKCPRPMAPVLALTALIAGGAASAEEKKVCVQIVIQASEDSQIIVQKPAPDGSGVRTASPAEPAKGQAGAHIMRPRLFPSYIADPPDGRFRSEQLLAGW